MFLLSQSHILTQPLKLFQNCINMLLTSEFKWKSKYLRGSEASKSFKGFSFIQNDVDWGGSGIEG